MHNIKIILSIIVLFVISANLRAQDNAREILDQVSTHLLSYSALQADFSFTLENTEADISDTFEGSMVMQGDKFRLTMMGILALCNGEMLWNYSEDLNEATIVDPMESEFFNPKNIFTLYQKDFDLKTISKKSGSQTIELLPSSENDDYSRILITIDLTKKLIREVKYFGTDDNQYIIEISNVIPDVQVDDRFFIFDASKYPDVEIFDMR
ncbi:MAG: outer membrane lipoprotein carrier protein LolA [Bacteroidetes bacterium]|jgi:outer membrane lipoprotein-sorting protein|nr:outer membrane lipoprotein carrier protein LolA [Bacteroidota bacterium]MBT3749589.1 outer membrane lipoprotein carrier protein LolA [Bacteroidota bacterium]MBT4399552.1 outer membrane lipoprotein carrier protein LolA [Bacteroidota bacterium]MBT4410390.1 outer membrane lipoprotein carrier protein LolA [Bacteroidota bacterium]MBT5426524.1 outer membrane lipoprotein carrier protein LolA [Bacteroidota bacterium]